MRSHIAECVRQKLKLEGTPLYILVKVLETAIGKLRKEMDLDQRKFIKDCAQSFPDDVIPCYVHYKLQELFEPYKKPTEKSLNNV